MAFLSMLATWLLSVVLCLIAGWKTKYLALWIGAFALFTFLSFAMPLTASVSARLQLRFWYLLITASVAWGLLLLALFLRESPLRMFTAPWPEFLLGIWVAAYAAGSCSIYLALLWLDLQKGAVGSGSG